MKKNTFLACQVIALTVVSAAHADNSKDVVLYDLGYSDGLTLEGQGARQTLFFPIPQAADNAYLNVDARFSAALDAQSSLTVLIDGEPFKTLMPRGREVANTVVDIPPRLLDGSYLRVEIDGDLAIERDVCSDNDRSSVWAHVDRQSGVIFTDTKPAETLDALWRMLSGRVHVGLPPTPSSEELESALTIMSALQQRGIESIPTMWDGGPSATVPQILIGDTPWPGTRPLDGTPDAALNILEVNTFEGSFRTILVQTPDAARLLAARDDLLQGQTHIKTVSRDMIPTQQRARGENNNKTRRLTLNALGYPTNSSTFSVRGGFQIEFPITRVPASYVPSAAVLSLRGPELAESDTLLVNIYTNGSYTKSIRLEGDTVLNTERIPLSRELLRGDIKLEIALQRLAPERPCEQDITTTVQLHGGSHIEFAPGHFTPARLQDWAARFDETVEVVLPDDIDARMRALPIVTRLLSQGSLPGTEIRVREQSGGEGPFIHVSAEPPESYDTVPIVTTKRTVNINSADGQVLSFEPGSDVTLVQLVERNDAWGVWVAPGTNLDLRADRGLGDGDAALIPPTGTPISLNTREERFDATYPESRGLLTQINQYRDALFWAFWIALTLGVAAVVIRMRRGEEAS